MRQHHEFMNQTSDLSGVRCFSRHNVFILLLTVLTGVLCGRLCAEVCNLKLVHKLNKFLHLAHNNNN